MSEQELTAKMVKEYQQAFHHRRDAAVIARAIQKNGIKNASEDPATGSSTPETPDTSGGGEDLMRQMF